MSRERLLCGGEGDGRGSGDAWNGEVNYSTEQPKASPAAGDVWCCLGRDY